MTFGEDKFSAMDVKRTDVVDIVLVRSFVKAMSPGVNDVQVCQSTGIILHIQLGTFVFTISG